MYDQSLRSHNLHVWQCLLNNLENHIMLFFNHVINSFKLRFSAVETAVLIINSNITLMRLLTKTFSGVRIRIIKNRSGLLVVQHVILQMMPFGDLLQRITRWVEWDECFNQDIECHFYSRVDNWTEMQLVVEGISWWLMVEIIQVNYYLRLNLREFSSIETKLVKYGPLRFISVLFGQIKDYVRNPKYEFRSWCRTIGQGAVWYLGMDWRKCFKPNMSRSW